MLRYARGAPSVRSTPLPEALGDFRAAGQIATGGLAPSARAGCRGVPKPPWPRWLSVNPTRPDDLSDEELELARAFGAPRALGVALRAAGLVAGGAHGQDLLREAIEMLSEPRHPPRTGPRPADLGALLRRGNQRVEARHLLRQALDAAHRLGATALARQAETELRATGAKPRRVLLNGLEALTASERRIAELAADGLTNREIAQTLFVTARTVEGHLTNVFNKLDVNARTALPAALAAPTQAVRA